MLFFLLGFISEKDVVIVQICLFEISILTFQAAFVGGQADFLN